MPPKKPLPDIKSPFQESFKEAWDKWKAFKKEQFRFTYKPMGEQGALDDLFDISGGDEGVAKLIIKQSLVKGWRGLFPIKDLKNGQPDSKNGQSAFSRQGVNSVFNSRYGNGQSANGGADSK